MTSYGYCRISRRKRGEKMVPDGESIDLQRRQIQGYAHMHGMVLVEVAVDDGVSGGTPAAERPGAGDLIARLRRGDDLVVAKMDRMFRSAIDALQTAQMFKKRGIRLHLIDFGGEVADSPLSQFFFLMAAGFAEVERGRIRERVSQAKEDQRRRGRYLGGRVPFGFVIGDKGVLAEDPSEQQAIAAMRLMRDEGLSLRAIAAEAQKNGHDISHNGVKQVLQRSE